nr:MAG TPA: hypothetical protein [Caudoviricetes sp.]
MQKFDRTFLDLMANKTLQFCHKPNHDKSRN